MSTKRIVILNVVVVLGFVVVWLGALEIYDLSMSCVVRIATASSAGFLLLLAIQAMWHLFRPAILIPRGDHEVFGLGIITIPFSLIVSLFDALHPWKASNILNDCDFFTKLVTRCAMPVGIARLERREL